MNRRTMGRLLCLLVCIGFAAVSLLSIFFVSTHAAHDCTGEHCAVCAQIHQAQSLLKQLGSYAIKVAPLSVALLLFFALRLLFDRSVFSTPVSQKIRLNN
ncbi:MAG TPA: hypothetical protein VN366_06540 [Feifaniaceae bacterium]|nr:hypothetical protein [Feifaniaceae bacterium]